MTDLLRSLPQAGTTLSPSPVKLPLGWNVQHKETKSVQHTTSISPKWELNPWWSSLQTYRDQRELWDWFQHLLLRMIIKKKKRRAQWTSWNGLIPAVSRGWIQHITVSAQRQKGLFAWNAIMHSTVAQMVCNFKDQSVSEYVYLPLNRCCSDFPETV